MPRRKSYSLIGAAAAATLLITSCGIELASEDVERQLGSQITGDGFSEDEFTVDCDGNIDAEIDEQMDCTLEWNDGVVEEILVTIVELHEDDDEIEYEYELVSVDGEPVQ